MKKDTRVIVIDSDTQWQINDQLTLLVNNGYKILNTTVSYAPNEAGGVTPKCVILYCEV